ncbi:MAG: SUMF1/EgtB/PvdO family nonheme iron enzyme [Acidobacteria bacterium]|nr:SUMF1/EgtB/PvdO family nonheme iron enzyme [Acidobacteriota bacterium]
MQATSALLQQRYEIVRPIAQGGMGAVYEGRDWRLGGSPVALKLCVFNTEQMRDIFEREANLLARLSHPHLPKVRDLFNEGAGQYIVMEYVPGHDLEKILSDFGQPLDHRTVLQWADQLLDALVYLHAVEPPVIHRDIKPANVKLTPQGHVMLLDFGLAKGHTSNLSLYGYTSAYAPIEQIRNSGTDPRSDLYSLGATLYRLLTGQLPENALARLEAMATTQRDPQRLASEFVPTIPLMVAQAVHRALALNREARFQSAHEMRESLQLALKTAPPPQAYAPTNNFETTIPQINTPSGAHNSEHPSQHPAQRPPSKRPPSFSDRQPSGFAQGYDGDAPTIQRPPTRPLRPPIEPAAPPSIPPPPMFTQPMQPPTAYVQPPTAYVQPPAAEAPPTARQGQWSNAAPHQRPVPPQPQPAPQVVRPANVPTPKPTPTMTVPLPAANLAKTRSRGAYVAAFLAVLVLGGAGLGLLSQQFLGRSSAEPPVSNKTAPAALPAQFTNRFGAQFTLLPAGKFTMGAANEADAQPPHIVTLSQPFYLGVYETTQQQWRALMRQNPSLNKGDALPVENVTWFEVQKYLAQINLLNDGYRYRLPTEAEWEYAARAGQAAANEIERFAWFNTNTKTTQLVGQKEPNAFGLHDMLGNVAEWCADAYHESYAGAPTDGEAWTAATGSKLFRVIRGESWFSEAAKVHMAYRNYDEPQNRSGVLGFRLVAEKVAEPATP